MFGKKRHIYKTAGNYILKKSLLKLIFFGYPFLKQYQKPTLQKARRKEYKILLFSKSL